MAFTNHYQIVGDDGGAYFKNSNGIFVTNDGEIEVEDGGTFIFNIPTTPL